MPDQMDEAKNIKRLKRTENLKRTEKVSQMLVNAMWLVLLLMVLGIGYALGVLTTPVPTAEPAPTAVPAEPYFVPVISRTGQPQIVALKGIDRYHINTIGYSYLNHAGELMTATPCWHTILCEWATPPVPMGYMMTVEVELKGDGGLLQWNIPDPNQELLILTAADVVVEELP